jgi:ABC-type nitrate/sulfonate/bicarbonate transport system substrate-binding protein
MPQFATSAMSPQPLQLLEELMGKTRDFGIAAAFAVWLGAQCHCACAEDRLMFKAGISDPVNTVLAWYVAQDAGLFAAHGLDVEIVNMNGGSRGAAELQAGRLDTMHVGDCLR